MPTSLGLGGPGDALIEADTPATWRQKKDAIFVGMDAYAVKALGDRRSWALPRTTTPHCAAQAPLRRLSDQRDRRRP